jgi:transcriptional accessory protein Tex/SPT6
MVIPNGGGLKAGMLFFGYIKAVSQNGCFVSLSSDYDIRVEISELSDSKVIDLHKQFPENKLVFGRLITEKIKPNNPNIKLFDGSLRESVVKYGYQLNFDTLHKGMTVSLQISRNNITSKSCM